MPSSALLRLEPEDDLVVALRDLPQGSEVQLPCADDSAQSAPWALPEAIAQKQKFALRAIKTGDTVKMYGVIVGKALSDIPKGGLIHTGNLVHATQPFAWEGATRAWASPDVSALWGREFQGFHREEGGVGTANRWIVIPLVFCENRNLAMMRDALWRSLGYGKSDDYQRYLEKLLEHQQAGADSETLRALEIEKSPSRSLKFPYVDGVPFLFHQSGCGETDQDTDSLCQLLAGYITHHPMLPALPCWDWVAKRPKSQNSSKRLPIVVLN